MATPRIMNFDKAKYTIKRGITVKDSAKYTVPKSVLNRSLLRRETNMGIVYLL